MKTLTKNIILLLTLTTTIPASAWDLKDILKAKNDSSKAGDIISGVVNSVTKQTMTIDDLQGTWAYSSKKQVVQQPPKPSKTSSSPSIRKPE